MKFSTIILLFSIVLAQHMVLGSKRLCGTALTEALKLICNDNFNKMSKKSFPQLEDIEYDHDDDDDDEDLFQFPEEPLLNGWRGRFMMPHLRRITRGVWAECCKKPCSLSEMMGYCLNKSHF